MKSYFSFIPREGENLSPVLCRTIIYELRELLSSESKALIAISEVLNPLFVNSASVQNTISAEFLINWIFVILVQAIKDQKGLGLFDTPGRNRGMETLKS